MVRTVNEAAHTQRRNAILDAAEHAVITKGYEQMAIADILNDLQISSGAFYHYFDSKPALLLALVERMGDEIEQVVLPIVHDPEPGALEKLQRFFAALDQWKFTHKRLILAYLPVWYGDENAIVRNKLYKARIKRLAPWLEEIIQQGSRTGVFTAPYPDQTARLIISLLEDIGYAATELLLAEKLSPEDMQRLQRILFAATDALERLLGAPSGCLQPASLEGLEQWVTTQADS
ncbi:TetR family transcriptional regulator [Reticulibacter mediterranei]|uniref:TetR family transcriptional regulator n=1 Tax=Reticulibacter mediterranei TaxID=2778369 RepID=A0A8J3N968_9CHLR|nr:TetR/AcrR family transcriptional regulator [Reticulibacter mediterranei]GHO98972.1 TetR family transcriptional regulator [Reticulibacter mediterranei]